MQERLPTADEEPNPYESPQSKSRPVRALAKRLGPLGTFVVALVALASGVIACGTTCYAMAFAGLEVALAGGAQGESAILGGLIGAVLGSIVGLVLLVLVTRFVFRWLHARLERPDA